MSEIGANAHDGKGAEPPKRIPLFRFDSVELGKRRRFIVNGLIPRQGLTILWGKPKSGKSFWAFDVAMHVALNWKFYGRRVEQGAVVYCAFEGQIGFQARIEAFRQHHADLLEEWRKGELLANRSPEVPFFLQPLRLALVQDYAELIESIRETLTSAPALVVLDTLNRSLEGSENSDEDMSAYVNAADAIRKAFGCAVIIVHHCGVSGDRPRGHSSLTGAADAQLEVARQRSGTFSVQVEFMKDGKEGASLHHSLKEVTVGKDEDGEPIISCVVVPAEAPSPALSLSFNQNTMLGVLVAAGEGLTVKQWNERAREKGVGTKRRQDLSNARDGLVGLGKVKEEAGLWFPTH
jgi:hypothetical protein